MNHHFAGSWLQSLEKKLDGLQEWTWLDDAGTTVHRNLFREFFSPQFQKTLALVDEKRKESFIQKIEKNLYKFEENTMQFPLGCLCAVIQYGKDAPRTHEKLDVWVTVILDKVKQFENGAYGPEMIHDVFDELLSVEMQKFTPIMTEKLQDRLVDGIADHLDKVDDEKQKRVLETVSALQGRIERLVVGLTNRLDNWVHKAPRYPATPLQLLDALQQMNHPLIKHFTALKDLPKKENFLVAVALALSFVHTRHRWMSTIEPELESLAEQLKQRFFTVKNPQAVQDPNASPVMDTWLSSRLKKYNQEALGRAMDLLMGPTHLMQKDRLRQLLRALWPQPNPDDPNSMWLSLLCPSPVEGAILDWLEEAKPKDKPGGFFCPKHTLVPETFEKIILQLGRFAQIDQINKRARLVEVAPLPTPGHASAPFGGQQGSALALVPSSGPGIVTGKVDTPASDNLIDLLLNEALSGTPEEFRETVTKISKGLYKFGEKEVTLHTQVGKLYVYRVGTDIRNMTIVDLLRELGVPLRPETLISNPGAVDTSAVSRMINQSAAIATGNSMTMTAKPGSTSGPFGSRAPEPPRVTDPQVLMQRRVEAAHKAMDVSKQIVRRSINFSDDKFMKKLVAKGLKHDKKWQEAYSEYCVSKGVTDTDPKKQDKDMISTFVERNLANSINQEWAQKIMYKQENESKDKKDKKREKKDKKEKKGRKRGSGSSSSSGDERPSGAPAVQGETEKSVAPVSTSIIVPVSAENAPARHVAAPPSTRSGNAMSTGSRPPAKPFEPSKGAMNGPPITTMTGGSMPRGPMPGMPMFPPGMPMGMMGMYGMPGMNPMEGMPGMPGMPPMPGMPGMPGMDMTDERARKKQKTDKDKKKKKDKS